MTYFWLNELWPHYQNDVNQIILNHTNLWNLALPTFKAFIWILLIVNLSLNKTLLTCLIYLRQTWMTQMILTISVTGYLHLIQKDSITQMHGIAAYVKEGLPFPQDLSLENSVDSYFCFRLALLHSVSYFFFLYWSPSSSLCMVFDSISSNMRFSQSTHLLCLSTETLMSIITTG